MDREQSGRRSVSLGGWMGSLLEKKWWVGVGVCVAAVGVVFTVFNPKGGPGSESGKQTGWAADLRVSLETLPDEPGNHLRVAKGETFELDRVEGVEARFFRSVILDENSTLRLPERAPGLTLRTGRLELRQGASILGSGRAGRSGEAGTPGVRGRTCANGSDGTDGGDGGPGGDGVAIHIETLELSVGQNVTIDTSAGAGGDGGNGGAGGRGRRGDRSDLCDGGDGGDGGNGGDGGPGGSAGYLRLRFGEVQSTTGERLSTNELIERELHVARAGSGGKPGTPGAAGNGGAGQGANILGVSADAGSPGNRGKAGEWGQDGGGGVAVYEDSPSESQRE